MSRAVIELMKGPVENALAAAGVAGKLLDDLTIEICQAQLAALSTFGIEALPAQATEEMRLVGPRQNAEVAWRRMAAAFHPSQLEKTDE